jgi:hypothetical protein
MKWRTEVAIPEGSRRIRYTDALLTLGSCFADHLGAKLSYYQFPHVGNPFGVIFHPLPLENLLGRAVENRPFTSDDLIESQGRWRCLEAHSVRSGHTPDEALKSLNEALEALKKALKHSTHAVLTLGTAYGFRHLESGQLVANCHKLPSRDFERRLSSPEALSESLSRILTLLRSSNEDLTCLLTVSPVRHIRDGLVENQRSKAHLITAVHALVQEGSAEYFPSYELFMDELRDYRFYDRDLIHPSAAAVDYVWERFEHAWIDPGAGAVMAEVDSIRKGLAHRPIHNNSREQHKFKQTLERKIQILKQRYSHMNFRE